MEVPHEKNRSDKMYLSYLLYGIEIHELSKLKIKDVKADLLNNNDKDSVDKYLCLLNYKFPFNTLVYFYFNFPEQYKIYPEDKQRNKGKIIFQYPYEVKNNFIDNEKNEIKRSIINITGYDYIGLIAEIIDDGGLAFNRYGKISYVMTHEEDEKLKKLKEQYDELDKYKEYFKFIKQK